MKTISIDPMHYSMALAAKQLDSSRRLTEHELKREMQSRGIMVSQNGSVIPSQQYIKAGFFITKPKVFYIRGSIPRHYEVTFVTLKGLAWLAEELNTHPTPKEETA